MMENWNGGMNDEKKAKKYFLSLQYSNIPTFHLPLMVYIILKNYQEIHKRIKSPLKSDREGPMNFTIHNSD